MTEDIETPDQEVVIDWLSGFCPVQAEGKIAGIPFYFRARGAHWNLNVGTDPLSENSWSTGEAYGTGFDAGWMELDEARAFIARGAGLWLEERSSEPHPAYLDYLDAELAWDAELRRAFGKLASLNRYLPEGRGEEGTDLRVLSDRRDAALKTWEVAKPLPKLREDNRED